MQGAMSNGGMSSPLNSVLRKTISPWYDDNPNPIAGASWPQYLKNAMVITPPRTHTTWASGLTSGTPIMLLPKNGGAVIMPATLMVGPASASASSPNIRIGYASNSSFEMTNGGSHVCYFGNAGSFGTRVGGAAQFTAHSGGYFGFASTGGGSSLGTAETCIFRPASATIGIYNPTSTTTAQTFELYNTWASTTSFENLRFKSTTGGAYEIGSAIGSAGGANQNIHFGMWNSVGVFSTCLRVTTSNRVGVNISNPNYHTDSFQVSVASTATTYPTGNAGNYGITINNPTNTNNRIVGLQFGGYEGWTYGGLYGTMTSNGGNTSGRLAIVLRSAASGFQEEVCRWSETSSFILTQWSNSSGSPTAFTLNAGSHTNLATGTEATDVNFNLARTVQFANGAITTQRAFRIQAPVYSHVSGSNTITTASTLSISGPPTTTGGFTTITNPYALNVESGRIGFTGGANTGGIYFAGAGAYYAPHIQCADQLVIAAQARVQWIFSSSQYMEFYNGSIATNGSIELGGATVGTGDVKILRDAASQLGLRVGTTAQSFGVYGTWTSATSYERVNVRGKASANFEIGPENGSAGGTLRGLTIGGYSAGTATIAPWLTFTNTGAASLSSTLAVTGVSTFGTTVNCNSNVVIGTNLAVGGQTTMTGALIVDDQTYIRTASLYFDTYGTHAGVRNRRANGTLASPTAVLSADVIGFWTSLGYHSSGAFHTAASAAIYMYAAENFTSTAQGSSIRIQTTAIGTIVPTTRLFISDTGLIGLGTIVPLSTLDVATGNIRIRVARTPASAADTGNVGEICWDSSYIYVCVAANTWKRVAIATW